MKKLAVVIAVLFFFSMTVAAQDAPPKMKPVIYAGGGLNMPISPEVFSDFWKMGINFGGGVGVQLNPNIEIIGKFYYNTFPFDWGPFADIAEGLDFKIMEFGADMKYIFSTSPGSAFGPFVVAGVGAANMDVSDISVEGVDVGLDVASETNIAIGFGAGFDYMASPQVGIWVEGRWNLIFSEGESTSYLPIRAGVKFLIGE